MFDKLIHKHLRLPYRLNVANDSNNHSKKQQPIIFLHGIASNSEVWANVLPYLNNTKYRLITVDLLGFGGSPKPVWSSYNLKEHSKNVAYTIKKLKLKKAPILVGHSMGCLIAVELASKSPGLFKSLVLLNMPIYKNTDIDQTLTNLNDSGGRLSNIYFSIYQSIINNKELTLKGAQKIEKRFKNDNSFKLDESTWVPFKNSLNNAIKNQNSLNQINKINVPVTIAYGRFDLLVINKYLKLLAKNKTNIKLIPINTGHELTPKYGKKIAYILIKEI